MYNAKILPESTHFIWICSAAIKASLFNGSELFKEVRRQVHFKESFKKTPTMAPAVTPAAVAGATEPSM